MSQQDPARRRSHLPEQDFIRVEEADEVTTQANATADEVDADEAGTVGSKQDEEPGEHDENQEELKRERAAHAAILADLAELGANVYHTDQVSQQTFDRVHALQRHHEAAVNTAAKTLMEKWAAMHHKEKTDEKVAAKVSSMASEMDQLRSQVAVLEDERNQRNLPAYEEEEEEEEEEGHFLEERGYRLLAPQRRPRPGDSVLVMVDGEHERLVIGTLEPRPRHEQVSSSASQEAWRVPPHPAQGPGAGEFQASDAAREGGPAAARQQGRQATP
jgi:hypothetical protein